MQFPISKKEYVVMAVAAPTSSYVAGTIFSMDTENFLGIQVNYTKGDETSLQVKVEASIDGGTSYGQQSTQSVSGGTVTLALAEYSMTATGIYQFVVNPLKADLVKISVKATSGTPTGTVGIKAVTSWA